MGRELGRISGPLLADNLKRNGHDLAFESQLLYLDVRNNRIAVNANLSTAGPSVDLYVPIKVGTTNLIVDTEAEIANFTFTTNQIQDILGTITISPDQSNDPTITTPGISTDNFTIIGDTVTNTASDSNINLTPYAGSKVVFTTTKVNVNGNLHATGDITWDGDITFGNADTDTVTFDAKVASSIVPLQDNQVNLGSLSNTWANLYAVNLNATNIYSNNLTVDNINVALPQGNTIYVSVNGNDASSGIHQHAPLKSIAHALSIATAGTEVVIFPGTYTEEFPLTVPEGVSVKGTSIRAVTIQPTVETKSNDAFLLNDGVTVSFLTVTNFYYDSENNTGYGFKLANGFNLTAGTRSPYVYNVSVITKGSVTSESDPLGFNQADAGYGAYIDGSVVNALSSQASCLFYAVTFITPNANGIHATNGARVEIINCFTYYANHGIYLTRGTLGYASLGVKFGAEARGINNANVYGTHGIEADGADTLCYIINHNFAYVGSGSDSSNNPATAIQANEVVAINGGEIQYESTDQLGDFRIGDIFYVQQSTGNVYFDARAINFTAKGNIELEGINGTTLINATAVEVANIRLRNNTIDSFIGPVNFLAYSETTTLNTNVNVTGDLSVSGDTNIRGNITFGNIASDVVTIADYLTQTIKPDLNNQFALGSSSKVWKTLYTSLSDFGNVQFSENTVTTLSSSLLLQSHTGNVNVEYLKFNDNTITNVWPTPSTNTQRSIVLSPNGNGHVKVDKTTSVILPKGTNTNRTLSANGEMRYNTLYNNIEAFESSGYVNFIDLYSQDQLTYITGELTPNASDDTLRFGVHGTVTTTVTPTALTTVNLTAGNVSAHQNIIQNTNSSNNLTLAPSSGLVNVLDFATFDNFQTLTNNSNTALTMLSSGTGHWKFAGTGGVVIPLGTNTNHPVSPVEGTVRFNTDQNAGEIYSNTYGWMPWIGKANTVVTQEEDENLSIVYTLMLGL